MRSSLSYADRDNTTRESFHPIKIRKKYHSLSFIPVESQPWKYTHVRTSSWNTVIISSRFDESNLSGISIEAIVHDDDSFIIPILSRGGGELSWILRRIFGFPISRGLPILWKTCQIIWDSLSKASSDKRYSLRYLAHMKLPPIIDVAIKAHTVARRVSR